MNLHAFTLLYNRQFNGSIKAGAEYFHVSPATVRRWLDGTTNINPMAEKLLIIVARGYLPNDTNWIGFQVNEQRGTLITPNGREFAPRELEFFTIYRDQRAALIKEHGAPTHTPHTKPMQPLGNSKRDKWRAGFRGGAAPWIPNLK